jgi:hypothetical protein
VYVVLKENIYVCPIQVDLVCLTRSFSYFCFLSVFTKLVLFLVVYLRFVLISSSSTMWIKITYVFCYFISYYNITIWVWTLGLWAVVNNAGINFRGDLELCLMDYYRRCHEVNLYGPIRIIKTFLPQIRKSKGWFDSMLCFYYKYLHSGGCFGHDRIVIWLTCICAISVYHCHKLFYSILCPRYKLDTNLCDKARQWR